jgi:intein/homing endonuclease
MTDNKIETYNPYWQDIIKSYFKANGFVKHQLDSFNEFVEVGIPKILNEVGSIEIKTTKESRGGEATYIFEFGQISIKKPVIREHDGTTNVLYPQEARNRNLTYHSSLYSDVKVRTIKNGEETVKISKEQLGYIPIMVRSKFCLLYNKTEKECKDLGECIYDEGGYFIVNGNEKAIVAQERMPNNIVYCFYKKPPSKIIWQAEIRSQFEYHIKTTSTFYIRIFSRGPRSIANSNPTFTDIDGIRGQITYIKQDIPIIFIFYALGFTSKNDIIDIITNSKITLGNRDDEYFKNILKFLRCSFDEASEIIKEETFEAETQLTENELQDFCLDYIGKKGSTAYTVKAERIKYATQIINRELLPHLNLEYEDIFKPDLQIIKTKAHFIGYMINKLYVSYLDLVKENDRDHLANKRLDLTGNLLTSLFKGIFKRLYKEAKVNLTKSIEANNSFDLMNNIKSKSITNDIKYALSTGNWGRQTGGTPPKTGVAQQLNRLTFSSGLSHLRRLNTPLNREGKQAKPRQLHSTNWGYVCVKPDTTVLLADGSLKTISDLIEKGDNESICVVDPTTRMPLHSGISAFQTFKSNEYNKKILKITTRSGRSITATEDHGFAVPEGSFVHAGKLTIGDRVLIVPVPTNIIEYTENNPVELLNRETFIKKLTDENVLSENTILSDVDKLEKSGLLPLISNDPRLNTLASLVGYNITDGHIYKNLKTATYYMGCKEDGEALTNEAYMISSDIDIGNVSHGFERKNEFKGSIHTTWRVDICSTFARLIFVLGANAGRKTIQKFTVPIFVKESNLKVKSAYLAAIFGGDGGVLWYNHENETKARGSRYTLRAPEIRLTKQKILANGLEEFLGEIGSLLQEFGIETTINSSSSKDKEAEMQIRQLSLNKSYENIIKFVDNIGYKWCSLKQNKMQITSEYIRYCQYTIEQTNINKQRAIELYNTGMGPSAIEKQMGINDVRKIQRFVHYPDRKIVLQAKNIIKWDEYLTDTEAEYELNQPFAILYDRITKIEEISSLDCPVVMDLTTESDLHTFVSNGFSTANCPAETPEGQGCGLLRNLAITCHVSIGSSKTFIILKKFFIKYVEDKFIEVREMTTEVPLYKVFLDGAWVVSVDEKMVQFLVSKLKKLRRKLMISFDTCICLDKEARELNLFTGPGRFCRPLLVVENLELLNEKTKNDSWTELLSKGIVEYIDIAEEEEIMIAMNLVQLDKNPNDYSHLEIHPSVILGICASIIPFPDHNQCIIDTSPVLMADGTSKMIKDIKIGEYVVTFDPTTLERSYSEVEYHMVKETDKVIYKITTLSGREMVATFDHKFFTNKGFIQVEDFDSSTKLGINLVNNKIHENTKIKILDESCYREICNKYTFKQKTVDKYVNKLSQWFSEIDTNKVSILAGIIGYLLADGCLTRSQRVKIRSEFCHSNEESAKELINDIEFIGFGRSKINYSEKTSIFGKNTNEEKEVTQKVYTSSYYGRFPILLEALGVSVGKRTTQDSSIPHFILNGSKEIQRSFLSGIFGGDGSKIRYNIVRNNGKEQVTLNTLSMSKDPEHIVSLQNFMEDVKNMLNKFDVNVNYIHTIDGSYGKKAVHLGFEQKTDNIIKFYEEIGYKYDNLKNQESGLCVEYLKYKKRMQDIYTCSIQEIRKDIDNNYSYKSLMEKYNKTYNEISHIKENYKNNVIISDRKNFKDYVDIQTFIDLCELSNNTLFIPITKELYTNTNTIADITVKSKNHTFMANNFLVHNSPRNIYQASMGKLKRIKHLNDIPITGSGGFARIQMSV